MIRFLNKLSFLLISFGSLIASLKGYAQSPVDPESRNYIILNQAIRLFDLDPLGNLYIVDDQNHFLKFDSTGQLLFQVVNNNLGKLHSLDTDNPFKIMAFYRDQQTVVLYDRTLSETNRIQFSKWDLQDVTCACLSSDNAIWLFDGAKKILIKKNETGTSVITSDPFDIIKPLSGNPDRIFDSDHHIRLMDAQGMTAEFDDFGKYIRTLPKGQVELTFYGDHLRTSGNRVYNVDEQGLYFENLR